MIALLTQAQVGVLVIAVRVPRPVDSKVMRRHSYCRYKVYDKYIQCGKIFHMKKIYNLLIICP